MKAIVVFSSIFFLLGLKLSSFIDFGGKANAVDTIITNKIINSKPIKALPLFNDSEKDETEKTQKAEKQEQETASQAQTVKTDKT